MKCIRQQAAGILALSSVLFLAACQSTPSTSTEAAGPDKTETNSARPEEQEVKPVTIPAGTMLEVRLVDSLSSARNHGGDSFQATLDEPVLVNGWVAVPKGADVTGRVVAAEASGHLETPAELSVTLASLQVGGEAYELHTSDDSHRSQSHAKHDAKWIGGLAGGGALLGALIGHGKGAAIGAGVGAGAGTGAAYATGKKDIYLPSETRLRFVLKEPVTVKIAS